MSPRGARPGAAGSAPARPDRAGRGWARPPRPQVTREGRARGRGPLGGEERLAVPCPPRARRSPAGALPSEGRRGAGQRRRAVPSPGWPGRRCLRPLPARPGALAAGAALRAPQPPPPAPSKGRGADCCRASPRNFKGHPQSRDGGVCVGGVLLGMAPRREGFPQAAEVTRRCSRTC